MARAVRERDATFSSKRITPAISPEATRRRRPGGGHRAVEAGDQALPRQFVRVEPGDRIGRGRRGGESSSSPAVSAPTSQARGEGGHRDAGESKAPSAAEELRRLRALSFALLVPGSTATRRG